MKISNRAFSWMWIMKMIDCTTLGWRWEVFGIGCGRGGRPRGKRWHVAFTHNLSWRQTTSGFSDASVSCVHCENEQSSIRFHIWDYDRRREWEEKNSVGILLKLLCFRKEEKRGKRHTKVLNDQITVVIDQIEAPRLKRFGHETAQHVHHFFHWLFIHHRQLFYQSYNWTKILYKRKYKQFKLLRKRERERERDKTSSFPTFSVLAEKQTDNTGSTCWSTSINFWW